MSTEVTTELLRPGIANEFLGGGEPEEEREKQQERGVSLSLEIPVGRHSGLPSPSTSSEPSSPNPLADSDTLIPKNSISETPPSSTSTRTASTSSLPATTSTLSVKFAPLPQLAPRKRRSNAPLGMAARGQLMRRRRGHYADQQQLQSEKERIAVVNSQWTPEELEEQRLRQEDIAARYAHYQASATAVLAREEEARLQEEEEMKLAAAKRHEELDRLRRMRGPDSDNDPFKGLGRTVKGIWKIVSKDKHKEKGVETDVSKGRNRKSDVGRSPMDPKHPSLLPPPVPPLLLNPTTEGSTTDTDSEASKADSGIGCSSLGSDHEQGGVWEEEVGDSFPLNISQTETIIEGRPIRSSISGDRTSSVEMTVSPAKMEIKTTSILRNSQSTTSLPSPIPSKASRASLAGGKS